MGKNGNNPRQVRFGQAIISSSITGAEMIDMINEFSEKHNTTPESIMIERHCGFEHDRILIFERLENQEEIKKRQEREKADAEKRLEEKRIRDEEFKAFKAFQMNSSDVEKGAEQNETRDLKLKAKAAKRAERLANKGLDEKICQEYAEFQKWKYGR